MKNDFVIALVEALPFSIALTLIMFTIVFPRVRELKWRKFMLLVLGAFSVWTNIPTLQVSGIQTILFSFAIIYTHNKVIFLSHKIRSHH